MPHAAIPRPDLSRFATVRAADLVLTYLAGQKAPLSPKLLAQRLAAVLDAAAVEAAASALAARGLLAPVAGGKLALADAGRSAAKALAGRDAGAKWDVLLTRRFLPLALGLDPEASEVRTRFARPDGRQAAIIAVGFGLPKDCTGRKAQVISELVWRTLASGLGDLIGPGPFPEIAKAAATERVILAALAGHPAKTVTEALKALASAAVGLAPSPADAVRNRLIALAAGAPAPARDAPPTAAVPEADLDFAARVAEVARQLTTPPFQGRVAIAQVYDAYGRAHADAGSLTSFKDRLVAAARAGRLHLERLDMPEYMDRELRQRSEAANGSDLVHFITTGAR